MKLVRPYSMRHGALLAAACLAAAFALSSAGARSPEPGVDEPDRVPARTLVQLMFPDAPDGVDPVVTGPTRAEFRDRQRAEGCDHAVWPNIPPSCYPR